MIATLKAADERIGYDKVEVPREDGGKRLLTKSEFEKLPLRERVDLIIKGQLKFFLNGEPIAATRALKDY